MSYGDIMYGELSLVLEAHCLGKRLTLNINIPPLFGYGTGNGISYPIQCTNIRMRMEKIIINILYR